MKSILMDGHRIAYREEGNQTESGSTLVLVHGTPSSSSEFSEVIDRLKAKYRCIAIDHLGFGESDKPPTGDYSLQAHTNRLSSLLFDHLKLESFHLLVTDFGGPIALPLAVVHREKLNSLTICNSWAWPLAETEPTLKLQRFILGSRLMRWLYLNMNFSARMLVKIAWGTHRPLTREKHQEYIRAFASASDRHGTVGFLRALIEDDNPAYSVHQQLGRLQNVPTKIVWGMGDKFISHRTLGRWAQAMPWAKVIKLDRVGHFVADEAPELLVAEVSQF